MYLTILQARLQQYMNWKLPDVPSGFRKGRDQTASICWIIEKSKRIPNKTSTSASLTMPKPLTLWITTNCGKFPQRMGVPDHFTCVLKNLSACQEATVRTRHETIDWIKTRKVVQGCVLSPCLFNLYPEYIIWNISSCDSWAGIKITRKKKKNQHPQVHR